MAIESRLVDFELASYPMISIVRRSKRIFKEYLRLSRILGFSAAFSYVRHKRSSRNRRDWSIRPKVVEYPFFIRGNTSDIDVFNQIFIENEYQCLTGIKNVGLVVDCGANVGFSSAYFLSVFPSCHVVAIEPDKENFEALRRNLSSYRNSARVDLINAGIWSITCRLAVSSESYRDGREWARQVRLAGAYEQSQVDGISIDTVLTNSGFDRISILKIDIEGAEAIVFGSPRLEWLEKVDNIAIELHDDSSFGKASEVFFDAIANQNFKISYSGELTICRRR